MRTIKSFWAIAECLVYAAVYEQMPETHRMWCWQGVPAGGNIVAVWLAGIWLVFSGLASLRLARSSFAFISGGTHVLLMSGGPAGAVVPRIADAVSMVILIADFLVIGRNTADTIVLRALAHSC